MAATGIAFNDGKLLTQEKRGRGGQQITSFKHSPEGLGRASFLSSMASTLGLQAGASAHAPYYLMFNFIYTFVVLAPRHLKQIHGIDDNVCPREGVGKYGDKAVQDGKMTREQLAMIKRNEAAQANRTENFAFFATSTVLAVAAGVPNHAVNADCLLYTLSSIGYGAAYILISDLKLSLLRTTFWWIGTVLVCIYCTRLGKH